MFLFFKKIIQVSKINDLVNAFDLWFYLFVVKKI